MRRRIRLRFDPEYAVISCYPSTRDFECKVLGLKSFFLCLAKSKDRLEPKSVVPKEKLYIITKTCGKVDLDEEERKILLEILKDIVRKYSDHFLMILNYGDMYDKRRHILELLPGIGRARRKRIEALRPYKSLDEVKEKLKIDIVEAFAKRLMLEILNEVDEKVYTRGLRAVAQG